MKTRCILVDDEPLAIELMKGHIQKLDTFELVATCSNAMQAMETLRAHQVDLMFMDIQMPQITGLEFLKTLKNPPRVIICTAYREYAIEGFELDVVDYLLKPITFERFLKAVNKYYQFSREEIQVVVASGGAQTDENAFIYVKENKKVNKIALNDILYIEGLSEYVKLHLEGRRIVTKASMSGLEEKLPDSQFIRIHKSYIVNTHKIVAFSANTIDLPDVKDLPIGRSYKNSVLKTLGYTGNLG